MSNGELLYFEAKKKLVDLVEYNKIPLDKIAVSFSGGKDSTLLLKLIEDIGGKNKVKVVFCNTMMEMNAMYSFVEKKREEGGVIEETKPELPMVLIYKKYGVPFHSKYTSDMVYRLQQHGFNFKDDTFKTFEELSSKYTNCVGALKWLTGRNITLNAPLGVKKALQEVGNDIKIANKCCEFLKKKPMEKYIKDNDIKLSIVGVRQDESQLRKAKYNKCIFEKNNRFKFLPLVFFSDEDVGNAINHFGLELSKAYTEYGCKRTGCFGCPFGKDCFKELEMLQKNEPNKAKACENLYKNVYDIYRKRV